MTSSEVAQAYKLAKSGEKLKAQNLLISVVKSDETNEDAWLLLAMLIEPKQKRIHCLQKVLQINPDNEKARKALSRLKQVGQSERPTGKTQISPDRSKILAHNQVPAPTIHESPIDTPKESNQLSDRQLLEQYISKMTSQGWSVISLTDTSVQLKKPKTWSATLLILGTLGIVFFGLGLLLIVIAVLDYVLKKDEIKFTTVQELKHDFLITQKKSEQQSFDTQPIPEKSFAFLNEPLFWVMVSIVIIFFCLFGIALI